jgi:hypothetical protein
MKKADNTRPYPPDFVSLSTLAYRLDLAERTVQDYVATGILPAPLYIGNCKRWRWVDMEAWLIGHENNVDGSDKIACEYDLGVENLAHEKAKKRSK